MNDRRCCVNVGLVIVAAVALCAGCSNQVTTPAGAGDSAIDQIDQMIEAAHIDRTGLDWRTRVPRPEIATFDPAHDYYIHMHTNKGRIVIRCLPDVAPMHVTSFAYLAKLGFYDGLSFHRVITRFMAQGGCPLGNGTSGPGYRFDGETNPEVKHDRPGLLTMANAGPGTDGSQFLLTFAPAPWLDGKCTIFGEVVGGFDTLRALENAGTPTGAPTEPLKMDKVVVRVREKPDGR